MRKSTPNETHRNSFTIFLGIVVLTLLILTNVVDAEPFAYVTNSGENTVSVIDTSTNNVIATVNVGDSPGGIDVSPDGKKIYVASIGSDGENGTVSVIDIATDSIIATVPVGYNPQGVAVSPDGKKVYVTGSVYFNFYIGTKGFVYIIDTANNTVTTTVSLRGLPRTVTVNPSGTKMYVLMDYGVQIFDTATNTVKSFVSFGFGVPSCISINPDGTKVYAGYWSIRESEENTYDVHVIDAVNDKYIGKVRMGSCPMGIVANPAGTKVYVTTQENIVSVIDAATNNVTEKVPVGIGPSGVSVTPDGTKVYVANQGSNNVSVVDTSTNTVIASVDVGSAPMAIGKIIGSSTPNNHKLFISNQAPSNKDHGSLMTYTLYYYNLGTSSNNVFIKDKLPDNITFISASDGGVYDVSTRTIRWNIGSVNSTDHGYRTLSVRIPDDFPVGTNIINNANIGIQDYGNQYSDNGVIAQTRITGSNLPEGVGVGPNNGASEGISSVTSTTPVTFSYHSVRPVTAVEIRIHVDDGGQDIVESMRPVLHDQDEYLSYFTFSAKPLDLSNGGWSDWTYTTTLSPRHGKAEVTYKVSCTASPYDINYDIRNSLGDFITGNDILRYIIDNNPNSPMLEEFDIGLRFKNSQSYGEDPAFLVATAQHESHFGTQGWALSHPEAHNALGYAVSSPNTPMDPSSHGPEYNRCDTWGDMITRAEGAIHHGVHYFTKGHYTVDQIRAGDHLPRDPNAYAGDPQSNTIADYMNDLYNFCLEKPVSFQIYIDPAGYIYDADTGNRIAGASVLLQRPVGSGGWQNVSTGENPPVSQPDTNPLISDQDGMYQWNTLPGSYRVHVEAPGYEPNDSIVVSVPPPVTDLHVGLHHIYDPNVPPILPVADFSIDVSSGYSPLSVQFTDLSKNATGISWDFGDGTSSPDRYPIHNYSAPGIYSVRLTTSNGNGINSKTGTIDVQAVPIYPLANFICNVTEGYAPLPVQFTDLSENEAGRNWDFGNGVSSTDKSPTHTYSVAGNYIVTLTVSNDNGTDSSFARINVSEHNIVPPQSISNLESSTEPTWINWTWTNPSNPDFNHTEIYLNGIFQTNTSTEYFNATGLQPETTYTLSTKTVDMNGNVNETWVNSTATTSKEIVIDVEKPVIQSAFLFPANTTANSKINITVNVADNVGVSEVKAGNIQLLKDNNGIWQGSITAPSSVGSYFLSIKASDTSGNTAETSVPYRVVQLSGGPNIAVSPRTSSIVAGNTIPLSIKVKNNQNIDDTFKVRISVSELPASYQANLAWFDWTEKVVTLRSGQEVQIPIKVNPPAGTAKGSKLFRANVNSQTTSLKGFDTGYLTVK